MGRPPERVIRGSAYTVKVMDLSTLNDQFAIPGVLEFAEVHGLTRAEIKTPDATATVYLQGAHITHWQPAGAAPVLFLSRRTDLVPGKPIRGGVPIAFPWFATDSKQDRFQGKPGPSHGFARIQPWDVAFAALSGDDLHLTLTLGPTPMSRDYGFDRFRLAYQITVGRSLRLQLTVANEAETPLKFEEALHTYFAVADVHEVTVTGLEPTQYIDKTDAMKEKPAAHAPLTFTGPTDRVYRDTEASCSIHDRLGKRVITNTKTSSATTVVFNPWKEMPDLGADEWHEFVCVETVNAANNAITLGPRSTHTMGTTITVQGEGA